MSQVNVSAFDQPQGVLMNEHASELTQDELELVSGGNFQLQQALTASQQATQERSNASKNQYETWMTVIRNLK
jgi:hypothetical protein